MISIYLGNEEIYVIVASAKGNNVDVTNVLTKKVSEGSIINGVITNEDALIKDISQFWEEHKLPRKNVNIVINSKQLTMKTSVMPMLSDKKVLNLVAMEFADSEMNAPIYDYLSLNVDSKKKKMDVLAIMSEADFVQSYIRLFSDLKIKVDSLTSGIANIVKVFYNTKNSLIEGSSLIQILDGNSLVSIIFSDGKYSYSQSTRIFSDKNSSELVMEIVNTISHIKQFYMSTNKTDINNVYFGGISDEILAEIKNILISYNTEADFIPETDEINFNGNGSICSNAYGIGSFINAKNDINLLKRINVSVDNDSKMFLPSAPVLISIGSIFGIVVILCAGFLIRNAYMSNKLNGNYEYLNNSKNQEIIARANTIKADNNSLERGIVKLQEAKKAIRTYPVYNTKIRNIILSCEDSVTTLNIIRFDSESGLVRIEASCSVANYTYALVDRLEATGLFINVDYNGYSYDERSGEYKINVDCTLVESAGQ